MAGIEWDVVRFVARSGGDFSFEMVLTLSEASYQKKFQVQICKIGQDIGSRFEKAY